MTSIPLANLPVLFDQLAIDSLPDDTQTLLWQIDERLPQTQCGLCGHQDGCLPYAHAVATGKDEPNLCVPGGDETAFAIAKLIGVPAKPAMPSKWQIDPNTNRPLQMRAVIDESACIGCTKCIPACPVDAIVGTAKHMHSIVASLCTGCELCLPPCPVDCIHLVPDPQPKSDHERSQEQQGLKQRYYTHLNRVADQLSHADTPVISHLQSKLANLQKDNIVIDEQRAKNTVELAKIRSQITKLNKQLSLRHDDTKAKQLADLQDKLQQLQEKS